VRIGDTLLKCRIFSCQLENVRCFFLSCVQKVLVYIACSAVQQAPIKIFTDLPLVYGDPTGMYNLALKLEQRWAECGPWARYGM
jgi:hypothetical protein